MVDFEDRLEEAYWQFLARKNGEGKWKETPQSERDAFKWAVREAVYELGFLDSK